MVTLKLRYWVWTLECEINCILIIFPICSWNALFLFHWWYAKIRLPIGYTRSHVYTPGSHVGFFNLHLGETGRAGLRAHLGTGLPLRYRDRKVGHNRWDGRSCLGPSLPCWGHRATWVGLSAILAPFLPFISCPSLRFSTLAGRCTDCRLHPDFCQGGCFPGQLNFQHRFYICTGHPLSHWNKSALKDLELTLDKIPYTCHEEVFRY